MSSFSTTFSAELIQVYVGNQAVDASVSNESAFAQPANDRLLSSPITETAVFSSTPSVSVPSDEPIGLVTKSFTASAKGHVVTALVLLAIFATCAITIVLGLPQTTIYGHDVFNFLDGGWRVLNGQVPHLDFYSAMGPIYYFIWALGFKVAHNRVEGIVYATVLVGVVLGLWSFAVARNRFGAFCASACTLFLICFWMPPFAIGDSYTETGYAMQYNRLGYVLFLIIFMELFGAPGQNAQTRLEWGGLSSGFALGLLLFLKANFFFVALAPIAFVYLFRIKSFRHGLYLLGGFCAVLLPMSAYMHWHLGSFLTDMRIAGGARATRKGALVRALIRVPSRNFTTIFTLGGIALLGRALTREGNKRAFTCLRWVLPWLALVLGCDFVLASSNMQAAGFPLSLIAVLLMVDQLIRQMSDPEPRYQWALAMCLFIVVIAAMLPSVTDLLNSWETEILVHSQRSQEPHVDAPQMASLGFKDHSDALWGQAQDNGHFVTSRTNEGIALLRQYSGADERISCLCFTNPFSYALLRKPPRGGSPLFDYEYNFSESFAPSAERIVGDAELVIYPKFEDDPPTVSTLLRISEPILSKKYRFLAESQHWVLLRRVG